MRTTSWVSVIGAMALCLALAGCPSGTSTSIVPNVAGQTQTAASAAITGAGLTVGAVTQEYSDTVPVGQVISQDPDAGVSLAPGSPVSLLLSAATETVMLPGNVPLEMVWIPGGTFTMGTNDPLVYGYNQANPAHSVTITAFSMDKTHVSLAEYNAGRSNALRWASGGGSCSRSRSSSRRASPSSRRGPRSG